MKARTRHLKRLRFEKRLSQMKVATRAKMSQTHYANIENGWIDPSDLQQARIAQAFGLPVSEVFPSSKSESVETVEVAR
jgi:transcriptional regulator with XRE-family HTH domain